MITCVACQCGSVDILVRQKLQAANHPNPYSVEVVKGRERGSLVLERLPHFEDVDKIYKEMMSKSRYAIIIGWDGDMMKYIDVANGSGAENSVRLSLLVERFANY